MDKSLARRLLGMAALFVKLGVIGFGGPAAHIAMIEEETVVRRGWLTRDYLYVRFGSLPEVAPFLAGSQPA